MRRACQRQRPRSMGYGWSSTTLRMTMVEVIFSTPGSRASCRLAAAHCDLLELRRRGAATKPRPPPRCRNNRRSARDECSGPCRAITALDNPQARDRVRRALRHDRARSVIATHLRWNRRVARCRGKPLSRRPRRRQRPMQARRRRDPDRHLAPSPADCDQRRVSRRQHGERDKRRCVAPAGGWRRCVAGGNSCDGVSAR